MRPEDSEYVLRFWFPELSDADHARMVRQFEWWFRGGADSAIAERFSSLLERATRNELDHWSSWPRPGLALIIVLDQFSRSLYRDTARAFAQDPKALALTLEGMEIGHYAALETPWEKISFHWDIPKNSRTWIAQSRSPSSWWKVPRRTCAVFLSTRRHKPVDIET